MPSRTLLINENGNIEQIEIFIYEPIKISDEEYSCRFTIKGGGFDFETSMRGLDGLQAFQISLYVIRDIFASSEKRENIFWLEPGDDLNI